jgi:Peptidase family M23
MALTYIAQLVVPLVLAWWAWALPPHSRVGYVLQFTGSLLALLCLARIGVWMFPPWWTPYAGVTLLTLATTWRWFEKPAQRWWPNHAVAWVLAAMFVAIGTASAYYGVRALAGAQPPSQPVIALNWPMRNGNFLVANGGNDVLINAHMQSMVSNHPRLVPWRGNGWSIDIVAIDNFGLRAPGFMPSTPTRYRIFGMPVIAPCSGTVVQAVDGLPDMNVPEYDRQNMAGNHVILACGDIHVAIAHFKRGSVRLKANDAVMSGQQIGEVGNSGGSNEPHLHIHAQRPGPPGVPFGGDPLPMTFNDRFLVRGDRIQVP